MSTASSGSKPTTGWQPPSLEEMQAMLPQYQFECLLGRGGMGAVYKAVQVSLDRAVAIKVLPGDLIDDTDAQFAERFKNEARTMAKMNHPSIVNVYDFGETQTGLLYIVMEFINGTDVAKMIATQGKLPEDYALSITAHVSDALAYAHKNGVIHRDIKPANILINMDGAVKVADFGLAKAHDPSQSGITKTNMAMGTPDFVAPEAFIPGVPLDGRADLYAMGVMLYQMLTGEIPRGIWTLPGKKLGTDPRFDAIITKAMQTDREHRYQSAADLRRDLDTLLTMPRSVLVAQQQAAAETAARATLAQKQAASGPQRRPVSAPAKAEPPPAKRSNLVPIIIGITATVVLVAGLGYMLKPPAKKPASVTAAATPTPANASAPAPARKSGPSPTPVPGLNPQTSNPPTTALPAEVLAFGGHRYQFVSEKANWDTAKAKAESMGGHLATITTAEENQWIKKMFLPLLNGNEVAFLGAVRDGNPPRWRWLTGETFDFTAWRPGQPSGTEPLLAATKSGGWDDMLKNSSYTQAYIIEWEDLGNTAPPTPPGWTDLLANADVARDATLGQWTMTADGLHCKEDGVMEYFKLNPTPPEEYDFEIDFTVLKGGQYGTVSQVLVVPGHRFALHVGSKFISLGANLDGKRWDDPERTEARSLEAGFKPGQRARAKVEIRRGTARVLIDDKEVINWSGDFKRLKLHTLSYNQKDTTQLAVACQNAEVVFHRIRVAPWPMPATPAPVASTSPAMPATPSGGVTAPVDLLALVDVKRDVVVGPWEMTPEGLALNWEKGRAVNVLEFNHNAPEEYDFEIEFTVKKGASDVSQLLPVTGRTLRWKMAHGLVPLCSFGPNLDGKRSEDPARTEAIVKRPHLKAGQRYRSTVEVRKGSLRALIDGEEVLRWSGDLNRLRDEGSTTVKDATHLGLGSYATAVTFHKAELRPAIDGVSVPMTVMPTIASTPAPTPATLASTTPAMPPRPSTPPMAASASPADFKSGAVHTFGGHRYQLIEEKLPWDAAKAKAESMGGHLAAITSKEEREWVHNSLLTLKGAHSHVFLGGYRSPDGTWAWVTGEPIAMSLWRSGPPTTTDPHLAFYLDLANWDDIPINAAFAFLVEWDRAEFLAAHPQLGKLETGFRSRYESDAQKPFLAALATLNQSYLANGIARARTAAQAKGSLAEVTALDAEKAALEKGEGVPIEDADTTPAALKTLRGTYRTVLAKITSERDAKAAPLYDLYLKALDAYIADLTESSKVSEAKHVSALRDEIANQKPQTVAAPVAATKPVTTPTVAPAAPPSATTPSLPNSGSSWRNAALFLVNNGGSCQVVQNGAGTRVATEQDIPSGRFDITEIDLNRQGSLLPPLKTEDLGPLNSLRELRRFHLRAGKPGIEDEAFAFLAYNGELKWLNLEGVPDVTDGVLAHIAPLKKLDFLAIQYATKFTGQGLDKIAGTDSITNLELPSCGITDEGMKAIGSFKKLRNLRLNSTGVTAAGFAALTGNRTLTSLNFSSTAIDDEAAGVLASMSSLTNIDLGATKITDAGLAKLKSLKKLTNLTLRGSAVSVEAAAEFQKAMPQCRVNR